jgi:hypothetical protein
VTHTTGFEISCKTCQKPIIGRRNKLQTTCVYCVLRVAYAKDKALRQDRRETKAKLEALKTRSDWSREAQIAVNRYIRLVAMSKGEGCYTCGNRPDQAFGHVYDAGHFRSVGSAPHLRFWVPQIRLQCIPCNRHQGGKALDFRRALVAEHGAVWVEELESRQELAKFSIDYLKRIKRVFNKKARRQEKRNGMH